MNSPTVIYKTLVQMTVSLLVCGSAVLAQSSGPSNTDWFHNARWGVMTHYLGAAASTAGGAELAASGEISEEL